MYMLPQEVEALYIMPAIRRELAKCLTEKHGVNYSEVSNILGTSKAAISNYLKGKRATKIKLSEESIKKIHKSCNLIIKKGNPITKEIERILKFIRGKNLEYKIYDKYLSS